MDKKEVLKLQNIDFNLITYGKKAGVEENVKLKIIIPLLKFLGYDINKNMDFEHSVRNKKADIGLIINGTLRIIVECKSLEQNLDKHIEQALDYAWKKQVNWVILTNGKETRLYRTWIENVTEAKDRELWRVNLKELDSQFGKLAEWVSYRSLSTNKIEEVSEEREKEIVESVTEPQLVQNLKNAKDLLTNNAIPKIKVKFYSDEQFKEKVEDWCANSNLDINKEDIWVMKLAKETAYNFINRIYFYRIAEDKGIVKPKLTKKSLETLKDSFSFKELSDLAFKEILKIDYKAIFEHNIFDGIEFDEKILKQIINQLSEYNFKKIDSDILGKIYEHHISVKERKELGQFYTPKKIINYILNRVGVTSKKKILDPACGSGGFLINVYDLLRKKYTKKGLSEANAHGEILSKNIFGMDINPFAVQLTAMNLALKNLEQKTDNINIISTDSLISNLNNWVPIKQDGLNNNNKNRFIAGTIPNKVDIVIGNPPYVRIRNIRKEKIKEYQKNLKTAKDRFDLFSLFIEKGLNYLDDGGRLGYIVPNNLLTNDVLKPIREYILDKCIIEEIVDLGGRVFEEANVNTIIIILKKEKDEEKRDKNKIRIVTKINDKGKIIKSYTINQNVFSDNELKRFIIEKKDNKIETTMNKIKENTIPLNEFVEGSCGIQIWSNKPEREKYPYYLSNTKENDMYKPLIEGKDITPFSYKFNKQYVLYSKKLLERAREERFFTAPEKIVMRYIGKKLIGAFDNKQFYTQKSVLCLIPKKDMDLRYILAIINSDLMNWYYLKLMGKNLYPRINLNYVLNFPIKEASQKERSEVIKIVNKIDSLEGKKEKKEFIKELNKKVFDIYGISKKDLR